MTVQPAQPLHDLDHLVSTYLDLADRIEDLVSQQEHVKAQLRGLGAGEHTTSSGTKVTVSEPARKFDLDRAWTLLTPEQQALCVAPAAAKVKKQLSQVLVDTCMEPGTGDLVVRIK